MLIEHFASMSFISIFYTHSLQ
uniref:Uncharacterized protein n=1 Tax=Anguilla anguilla TaxID=7936 RepID=A0A0E9PGF2_ANGAN